MKKVFFLAGIFGVGLLLSAVSYQSQVMDSILGAGPINEFQLMTRLNGSPIYLGHTAPGADGGTRGTVDGGLGGIVKTQCYSAACVCVGDSTCTCGNNMNKVGLSTSGVYLAANGSITNVLTATNYVTTSYAVGSLLSDGGAGAECDHWSL